MRILIVEDDLRLTETIADVLNAHGYTVDIAQDGEQAWDLVTTGPYNLVILDVTLPKLDGIHFCERLRMHKMTLPVLMLTARDTLADKIIGLDAGADDYMVKPFEMPELRARIRALLRRSSMATAPDLSWELLHLNPSTYEVTYSNQSLRLTAKEFALLELLMSNGRHVLSRTSIIERIWSLDEPPTEETVKSHLKALRHKLREAGAPDDLIETVHGIGYRLKPLETSL